MKLPRFYKIQPFDRDSPQDAYLSAHAQKRNISTHALLRRLVMVIARDEMISAILDDGDLPAKRDKGEHRFLGKPYGQKNCPL